MAADGDGLRVLVEWEDPGGVRSRELHATWCRLEIWAGTECVTRVEEESTSATRRSIYVPLYPFAEWAAYNLGFLLTHSRPGRSSSRQRAYGSTSHHPLQRPDWLRHHNVRAVGEGFAWPDLAIIPEGAATCLTWFKSDRDPRGGLRYVTDGEQLISTASVKTCLETVIELTLTRLDEAGITDTPLHEEWRARRALDPDELEFCDAAARMGIDPFDVDDDLADSISEAGNELHGTLLNDFLDVADRNSIRDSLTWVSEAARSIEALGASGEALLTLRDEIGSGLHPASDRPWVAGYSAAQLIRRALGSAATARFEPSRFMADIVRPSEVRGVDAVGRNDGGLRIVRAKKAGSASTRFTRARALWSALQESTGELFVLTAAHTSRQQAGRSFAAELLAPAEGIRSMLASVGPHFDTDDVDAIAEVFDVQPLVIEHQIENHAIA